MQVTFKPCRSKSFERQVRSFQRNASITSPLTHRIMKLNGRAAGRQLSAFPPLGSSVSILLHLLGLFVLGKEQCVSAIHLSCYSDQNLPLLCLITFSLLHIAERDLAREKGFSRWSAASCRQALYASCQHKYQEIAFALTCTKDWQNDCVTGRWASRCGHVYLYRRIWGFVVF